MDDEKTPDTEKKSVIDLVVKNPLEECHLAAVRLTQSAIGQGNKPLEETETTKIAGEGQRCGSVSS